MSWASLVREWARSINRDVLAFWLAVRDLRTPLQNRREPLRQGQRRSRGEKERPHLWYGQV